MDISPLWKNTAKSQAGGSLENVLILAKNYVAETVLCLLRVSLIFLLVKKASILLKTSIPG